MSLDHSSGIHFGTGYFLGIMNPASLMLPAFAYFCFVGSAVDEVYWENTMRQLVELVDWFD